MRPRLYSQVSRQSLLLRMRQRLLVHCALLAVCALILINAVNGLPLVLEDGKYLQRINLVTGERYVKDLTRISEPDAIPRLRLLIGTAKAMSSHTVVDVFRLRLRWLEPDAWNDNWMNVTQRTYDIVCEIEDENTKKIHRFVDMRVDSTLTGYDENFLVRSDRPLLLRCRIRAVNSLNLASAWRPSQTANLQQFYQHKPRKTTPTRVLDAKMRTSFFNFA